MCDFIFTPINNGDAGKIFLSLVIRTIKFIYRACLYRMFIGNYFSDAIIKDKGKLNKRDFCGKLLKFSMHDISNSDDEFSDSRDGSNVENQDSSVCKCFKCGKDFFQLSSLQYHDHFYCNNNTWICDFTSCEKRFNLQEYLDIHKRVHVMGDMDKKEEVISIFPPVKSSSQNKFKRSKKTSSNVNTGNSLLPSNSSSLSAFVTTVGSCNESLRRRCSPPLSLPLELDDEEHEILFAPVHDGGQVDLYIHDFKYDLPASPLPLLPATTPTAATPTTNCSSSLTKGILKRSPPSPYSNSCIRTTSQPPTSNWQCRRRTVTFAENIYVLSFRSHESICPPQIARAGSL